MTVDMTPPPAVVEFAEKSGYKNGIDYVREWQGYKVYVPDYSDMGKYFGLPNFILVKDDEIRWNDEKEQEELIYLGNKEAKKN